MGRDSTIEWTKHTKSIWWGCEEVSPGCDFCYARTLDNRYHHESPHWGVKRPRLEIKSFFTDVMNFQREAQKAGRIDNFFVNSMSDIFEKSMPLIGKDGNGKPYYTGALRDRYFNEIVPATPNLLHLMLTKRPSNINKYIPQAWLTKPPQNVMFGTSPVNQATANILIPQLLKVNGKKFLSCEPLLGPIDFHEVLENTFKNKYGEAYFEVLDDDNTPSGWAADHGNEAQSDMAGINWVIVGGESGNTARPMHPDWVLTIKQSCDVAGVPFFFKQHGEWKEGANMSELREKGAMVCNDGRILKNNEPIPKGQRAVLMSKVGKKEAGHLLNGKEYFNFPINR